jgi:hypothetical protein
LSGGLEAKRKALEKAVGYPHSARLMRAEQIRRVQEDPSIIDRILDARRLGTGDNSINAGCPCDPTAPPISCFATDFVEASH